MLRRLVLRSVVGLLALTLLMTVSAFAAGPNVSQMPANIDRLGRALQARGVIPAGADEDQVQAAVEKYLQQKIGNKPIDRVNPLAARALKEREAGFEARKTTGKRLGQSAFIENSTYVPNVGPVASDNILILLVEFADPAHNQIPMPNNNVDYWVSDFTPQHYQDMLFDLAPGAKSMANYYLEQSREKYTVAGKAYGWFKLPYPESYYGKDSNSTDDANGPVYRIVGDALAAAGNSVPWAEYDKEDPYDLDGDGNYNEPDGYIDHLMIIHAGAGQEAGGGAQGDDAIWSHSWWANWGLGGPGYGGYQTSDPGVWAGAYTIEPEDGAIGVFAHEFGHDLGLPDEYDTIYSGEAPTAFYSLMASGSWTGRPLGTEPSDISVWGKYALGWVDPVVVDMADGYQEIPLDRVERPGKFNPAIRVNLPKKTMTIDTNTPYSGLYEWFSGSADDLNNTLSRVFDLSAVTSATLSLMMWYDIELDYDYGFVEVSTDGGATWTSVPSEYTKVVDTGVGPVNAITGTSNGWVRANYDLTPWAGREIKLRFRYSTDGGVSLKGWTIDDISINAIGFFDNVDSGTNAAGWEAKGWTIYKGSATKVVSHYYMLEWRTFTGFDETLRNAYNFVGDNVEFYSYNPGLLLWYRDAEYNNNWVGVHPGHGFLLIVDSHPVALRTPVYGIPWRARVQIMDAPFGREQTISNTLTRYGVTKTYPSLGAEPWFNDKFNYFDPASPTTGVILPTYGFNFQVKGVSEDGSAALIGLGFGK